MKKKDVLLSCVLCLFLLIQTGCASKQKDCVYYPDAMSDEYLPICGIADPLEPLNRVTFKINDTLWTHLLDPVSKVWRKIPWIPDRVDDLYDHITSPVRFFGALAQGKGETAGRIANEFVNNTFYGGFGLFDVVPGVYQDQEDIGQGLAHWGVGEGFWIVWPIFGGKSLRDSVGCVGDNFLTPALYVDTALQLSFYSGQGLKVWNENSETYFKITKANFDPYKRYQEWYLNKRRSQQLR